MKRLQGNEIALEVRFIENHSAEGNTPRLYPLAGDND